MSKEICPMCAEEICICGEAYKGLGASQLEILIPILVQQYENTPEYHESMARHVNVYGSARRNLQQNSYQPFPVRDRLIDSGLYLGHYQHTGLSARQNDQTFRYDMLIPGLIVRWGEHHGKLVAVTERNSEANLRYKMLSVEDPEKGVALFATGPVDNYNWANLDGQHHVNIRILDMFIEVPDEMREEVAKHLVTLGHEYVHRKLALMFGTRHSSLSEGLELGRPPYGFGHEKRAFDYRQVSPRQWAEIGERKPHDRDEQIDLRQAFASAQMHTNALLDSMDRPWTENTSEYVKYRPLRSGTKFKFLEAAGPGFVGEWVVTGFQLFDEDKGPKLQVASIVAMCGEDSIAFYTSYSVDQVDEALVPFVSMEHIEILPISWDDIQEPTEHPFKQLQVGKKIGFRQCSHTVEKFTITKLVFRAQNYGLHKPDELVVLVTIDVPEGSESGGVFVGQYTFYTSNSNNRAVGKVEGADDFVYPSDLLFEDQPQ